MNVAVSSDLVVKKSKMDVLSLIVAIAINTYLTDELILVY